MIRNVGRLTAGILVGLLLTTPLAAETQEKGKVYRVGFLAQAPNRGVEIFKQDLRELGCVEGQNLAIESGWKEGRSERLAEFVADLIRLKVDLIVARGKHRSREGRETGDCDDQVTTMMIGERVADFVREGFQQFLLAWGEQVRMRENAASHPNLSCSP